MIRFYVILCSRFMNRNLFKYVEFDPAKEYKKLAELDESFSRRQKLILTIIWLVILLRICRMIFIVRVKKKSGCRFIC